MTRPNCWQPPRIEIIALKRSAAENPEGDSNTTPANILWILHFGRSLRLPAAEGRSDLRSEGLLFTFGYTGPNPL